MKYRYTLLLLFLCALLQTACSNNTVYPEESFAYDSLFKLRTDGEVAMVCDSARRALLGQGYLIANANSEGVVGRKAYKSEGKENTFIEMNVVCLPENTGSTVFATGVLSTYALKMSTSSASVGLSALGSISLPIGQSADSLVKISEETIDDQDFYRRFFAAVDTNLSDLRAGKTVPEPAAPAPAPVVGEPAAAPAPTSTVAPTATPTATPAATPSAITPAPMPSAPAEILDPVPAQVAPPEAAPAQTAPAAVEPTLEPEVTAPAAPVAPAEVLEPEVDPAQAPPASAVETQSPVQESPATAPQKILHT